MPEKKQVIAPASDASIKLAQLAGFNADLADAKYRLVIAGHMVESTLSSERNLVRPLVGEAIVAYGRCFARSRVRPYLDAIITVPAEHIKTHKMIKRLRNGTVAHSDSTLTPSYSIAVLERDETTGEIRAIAASAMTVHASYSVEAISLLHALVDAVKKLVLIEIEKAKAELIAELNRRGDLQALWDSAERPELMSISLDEWDVDTRREAYPDSTVVRVLVDPAKTFLVPSSGHVYDVL